MNTATATMTRPAFKAPPPQQNQVTTVSHDSALSPQQAPKIGEELKARESQFKAALPAHIPLERFMRVVMTAIQRNPELAYADRASLFTSAMQAAQDGLLPDGREGALVIYNTKVRDKETGKDRWIKMVQWMPMIAGIRKKVRNSGEIATWEVQVVQTKDHFEFELGDDPFIRHKPFMTGDRGPVVAAYSVATLKSGEKSREVMTVAQIEKVRSRSKQKDQDGNPTGPWKTDYEEMCRKTVARRHSKVLPMSTDLDDLIRRDDDLYDLRGARDEASVINGGRPQSLAGKLDALSQMPERPGAAPPAHDPETGEVESGDAARETGQETQATTASGTIEPPADDAKPDPTKLALLKKLRLKAEKGTNALRLAIGGLKEEERDLLTDQDHEELGAVADAADPKKGGEG